MRYTLQKERKFRDFNIPHFYSQTIIMSCHVSKMPQLSLLTAHTTNDKKSINGNDTTLTVILEAGKEAELFRLSIGQEAVLQTEHLAHRAVATAHRAHLNTLLIPKKCQISKKKRKSLTKRKKTTCFSVSINSISNALYYSNLKINRTFHKPICPFN